MRCFHWKLAFAVIFFIFLAGFSLPVQAQNPEIKKEEPKKQTVEGEKGIAFEFQAAPWRKVFEWISDTTGKPFIGKEQPPPGTFTFINPRVGPKREPKKYTFVEIIDIINEALADNNLTLLRRENSFTLIAADKALENVPRVDLKELENRGSTEVVSIVLPLKLLVAEDVSSEVKKMMGPFGQVIPLSTANQLVMTDSAGSLRRIQKTIKDIEDKESVGSEIYSHQCMFVRASTLERLLKEAMGDSKQILEFMKGSGGPGMNPGGGGGRDQGPPRPTITTKVRVFHIASDDLANKVHLTGSPDKISQAKALIAKIDAPQPGQKPLLPGAPSLQTYNLQGGNAEIMAKVIQEQFKTSPSCRLTPVGGTQLLVWGTPEEHLQIGEILNANSKTQPSTTELIPLSILEATKVADTLKGIFGDVKTGAPYIEADVGRNAIIVKGTPTLVKEVRTVIEAIGESPTLGGAGGNMQTIILEKGSAATMAEAIRRMMIQMRPNPIKVITPGSNPIPENSPQPKIPMEEKGIKEKIQMPFKIDPPKVKNTLVAGQFTSGQLVDPKDLKKPKEEMKGDFPPVIILGFGNKLIVTSDDPKALTLVRELVRLVNQTAASEGDFEFVKLKYANAVDAAKILDEAFNGGAKQGDAGGGGRGRGGPGGGGPGGGSPFGGLPIPGLSNLQGMLGSVLGGAPAQRIERIRIVADMATNSLLVKANPLDMLTIRNLMEKIDVRDLDNDQVIQTYVVGPLKYASAVDVANVIKDVYRESMNNNPRTQFSGGFSQFGIGGGAFGGAQRVGSGNVDANGNPRGVSLSIGIDDRTNSLILACPAPLYKDIGKLVENLEKASSNSQQVVRVIPTTGVDPQVVEQLLDALQGKTTSPSSSGRTGSFGTSGFGGPGGFGGSGFTPGGFGGSGFTPGGGGGGKGRTRGPNNYRGPDFFESRVTDDPSGLFDPTERTAPINIQDLPWSKNTPVSSNIVQVGYQAQEKQEDKKDPFEKEGPKDKKLGGDEVTAPRLPVIVDSLPQLGGIVIRAGNKEDMDAALKIVELILGGARRAEVVIEIVPLKEGDATSVTNILNQVYSRLLVGPNFTTQISRGQGVTAGGGQQQFQQPGGVQQQPGGQQPGVQTSQQTAIAASVILIALPRQNAILVGAPKARMEDIKTDIAKLDRPIPENGKAVSFKLKRAAAAQVANQINSFFATRYPPETQLQNQIRVTFDTNANTVVVQASPGDLAEIRNLVELLDTTASGSVDHLRIVTLKYAVADDLAQIITRALSEGLGTTSTQAPGVFPTQPGGPGGQQGPGQQIPGGQGTGTQSGVQGTPGGTSGIGTQTPRSGRVSTIKFFGRKDGKSLEANILDDVRISSVPQTNTLVIAAPEKTMELILGMIRELDMVPAARAEINVFQLKRADAAQLATTLQQLFLGNAGLGTRTTPGGGPGVQPGIGQQGATAGGTARPLQLTVNGQVAEGAPLIDLRISVDERTNSLIVAGSRSDLDVVEAIIARIEDANIQQRFNEAVRLQYAQAADVAVALNDFITKSNTVLRTGNQLTSFQEIQRDIVIVAEPISNHLLVSATPQYFDTIVKLIHQLDYLPPQVVVQILVAEVDFADTNEFGVEIGLQSPVLFQRGIFPAPGQGGTLTYSATTAGASLMPQGVTLSGTTNPASNLGYNFNNVLQPLGNNVAVNPGIVGYQGLGNLGVGRISPTQNIGGFVFSAASDSFNLLIRSLRVQNRIDILSRPQLTTLDGQTALINVGQEIPIVTSTNVTATGLLTQNIDRRNVGVILQVTPKISPDGRVLLRVVPEVSSVVPTPVQLGNGNLGTALNIQHLETTVSAYDGETVALGGLITHRDTKNENKIPWLGDLPGVGAMFRYRTRAKSKTELLIIMTPHVVRCKADADKILAEEARKMDWILGNVLRVHGENTLDASALSGKGGPPPMPTGPIMNGPMMNGPILNGPGTNAMPYNPVPNGAQVPSNPLGTNPEVLPVPRPVNPGKDFPGIVPPPDKTEKSGPNVSRLYQGSSSAAKTLASLPGNSSVTTVGSEIALAGARQIKGMEEGTSSQVGSGNNRFSNILVKVPTRQPSNPSTPSKQETSNEPAFPPISGSGIVPGNVADTGLNSNSGIGMSNPSLGLNNQPISPPTLSAPIGKEGSPR